MELPYPLAQTNLANAYPARSVTARGVGSGDEARGIFERLEARAWLDRLDEALARDGDPIISATRSHPSSASTPTPTA